MPASVEEDARDEFITEMDDKDKPKDRFSAIEEDKMVERIPLPKVSVPSKEGEEKVEEGEQKFMDISSWNCKVVGDAQTYGGETSYAMNVLNSNRWPGSTTVAKNGKFFTIYVGDLIKRGDTCFNPVEPPMVLADPVVKSDQEQIMIWAAPKVEEPEKPVEVAEGEGEAKEGEEKEEGDGEGKEDE